MACRRSRRRHPRLPSETITEGNEVLLLAKTRKDRYRELKKAARLTQRLILAGAVRVEGSYVHAHGPHPVRLEIRPFVLPIVVIR